MKAADLWKQEWESEEKQTLRVLEAVPEDKLSWKPHEKSMTLGGLAQHIAQIPAWGQAVLGEREYVMTGERLPEPASKQEFIDRFRRNAEQLRERIGRVPDESLADPWTLKAGDHTVFTAPRSAVVRSFLLNHIIHHRGQLTVYLRLLDAPVPGVYGPSADEN